MKHNSSFIGLSDEELFYQVRCNSEIAFDELYNRYWDKLFIAAIRPLRSTEDAEEVVHDVFLNIWKLRSQIQINKSLNHYLAAAVKFNVINRLRKHRRRELLLGQKNNKEEYEEDTTGNYIRERELIAELEEQVKKLPEKCQLVFRMSREENLKSHEIAEKMGVSVNTVDSHLSKALRLLRNHFGRMTLLAILLIR